MKAQNTKEVIEKNDYLHLVGLSEQNFKNIQFVADVLKRDAEYVVNTVLAKIDLIPVLDETPKKEKAV